MGDLLCIFMLFKRKVVIFTQSSFNKRGGKENDYVIKGKWVDQWLRIITEGDGGKFFKKWHNMRIVPNFISKYTY